MMVSELIKLLQAVIATEGDMQVGAQRYWCRTYGEPVLDLERLTKKPCLWISGHENDAETDPWFQPDPTGAYHRYRNGKYVLRECWEEYELDGKTYIRKRVSETPR